jgi:hypothetical protein
MATRNKKKYSVQYIFPFLAIKLLRISLGYLIYFVEKTSHCFHFSRLSFTSAQRIYMRSSLFTFFAIF